MRDSSEVNLEELRKAHNRVKQLEKRVADLQRELKDLHKQKETAYEYHYIIDADDHILSGFFRKKLPDKS